MPKRNRGAVLEWRDERRCWEIIWFERGRRRRKSTGTESRGRADRILAEWLVGRQSKRESDPSARKIGAVLQAYASDRKGKVSYAARIGYAIKALTPYWGEKTVSEINEDTCQEYDRKREAAGIAVGTRRKELGVLRSAVNRDVAAKRLSTKAPVWLPPRPEAKDRWLTREEAAALIRAARKAPADHRDYLVLFILIGLYIGARKGAILSLRWPKIDLDRRLIDLNPVGRARTKKGHPIVRIPKRLVRFLRYAKRHGTEAGYVISHGRKRLLDIKKGFAAAAENAGLDDVTPHTLRHTCISWQVQAGVPFPVVARYAGHADSRLTESVYAHHAPDYLDEAADALDRPKRAKPEGQYPGQSQGERKRKRTPGVRAKTLENRPKQRVA